MGVDAQVFAYVIMTALQPSGMLIDENEAIRYSCQQFGDRMAERARVEGATKNPLLVVEERLHKSVQGKRIQH